MIKKIRTLNPARVAEIVKDLNKRAVRHGLPLIEVVSKKSGYERFEYEDGQVELRVFYFEIEVPDLTKEIKMKGYTFLAKVEKSPGEENYIHEIDLTPEEILRLAIFSEADALAKKYGIGDIPCDHCGHSRIRNVGYVFEKEGKLLIVGSTCVHEYFGIKIDLLLDLAARSSFNMNLLAEAWDEDLIGGLRQGRDDSIALQGIFSITAAVVLTEGYTSVKKTEDDVTLTSTKERVLTVHRPFGKLKDRDLLSEAQMDLKLKYKDPEEFEKFIEYYRAFEPKTDFDRNLKIAITTHDATHLGFAIFGTFKYLNETIIRPLKEKSTKNEYVGKVGERREFTLTLLYVNEMPSQFGNSYNHQSYIYLLSMTDEKGQSIIWWSTKNAGEFEKKTETGNGSFVPWNIGETRRIKATIKSHKEYKGKKQTTITRGKYVFDSDGATIKS